MRATPDRHDVARGPIIVRPHLAGVEPATPDGRRSSSGSLDWDGRCDDRQLGCAAYMPVRVPADPRASSTTSSGRPRPRLRRERRVAGRRLIALLDQPDVRVVGRHDDDRPRPRPRDDILAAALDAAGAELRAAYGDPANWTWGRAPPGDVPGGDARAWRDRAARVVLQQGPGRGRRAPPARSTTTTTGSSRPTRTRTTRTTCRSGSTSVFDVTNAAVLPAADRHERPRRRADRPDDRPERQPVRPPLRRPDRPLGWRATRSRSRSRRRRVHEATRPDARRWSPIAVERLLLADRERAVRDLDQDAAVLDDDRVDLERQLGRRIERLAVGQVEPRQVERAGQRAGRQEALVELEVLVACRCPGPR